MTNSGLVEVNGADIYFQQLGQGEPLLLIHAGVADSRMWDAQVDAFSRDHQVIRFDLRGFGRSGMPPGAFSNVEDVRALLDHLNVQSTHLLGISFGGAIAIDFALAYPAHVRSLILGAPSVGGARPSDRIRRFWLEEEEALEAGDLAAATELNLRLWVDGPERTPEQVDPHVREQVGLMQLAIFQKEIPDDIEEIDLDPPAASRLSEIQAPTLVLVGALDLPEKVSQAQQVAAAIPGAGYQLLPDVAHMLNMERPEQFNQSVLGFLASHERT